MENTMLKKKLSTYRSEDDSLRQLPPEVLLEVLTAWEQWPGKGGDFYASIGVSSQQMGRMLGKAKKLRREGHFPAEDFKELGVGALQEMGVQAVGAPCGIEISWEQGKVIRFAQVEQLVEFLKKVA